MLEESRKERYSAFLNFYHDLLDLKLDYDEIEKNMLKKNIETRSVFMKQWLLEKIDEVGEKADKAVTF